MKKLKRHYYKQYKQRVRPYTWEWEVYPCIRSHTHKHFSTKQEKSYYFLHRIELRNYPIKLRAARGGALANPWDDYPSSVYALAKSWKHNSKRRNQYYR